MSMLRSSVASFLLPILVACGSSSSGYTKDEARDLGGKTPDGEDICALEGWYNDAECDDFCPFPDPDCDTGECPDPSDPNVWLRLHHPRGARLLRRPARYGV
jgi:hypothetical protein